MSAIRNWDYVISGRYYECSEEVSFEQLYQAFKERYEREQAEAKALPIGICPKCHMNRFENPCPMGHGRVLECPMVGTAA